MKAHANSSWSCKIPKKGILTLSGYGLRIAVERGHLVFEDGVGRERRQGRLSRVSQLKRLVVLGHAGTISLEALRWLRDVGAGYVQIDADGSLVAATGPTVVSDPRVLRGQVLAAENGVALSIARQLVVDKLKGQLNVLRRLPEPKEARGRIKSALALVDRSDSFEHLRHYEADAAKAYWQAWEWVGVGFGKREAKRVPDHWLNFRSRTSPHTKSPRAAANPANAMLNYLYAILEAEARVACMALGLDPGLGLYHADQRYRDSLACDLMEPVRPAVDSHLLQLVQTRTFRMADFFENRQGVCRVMPPVSQQLALTAGKWSRAVAPVVERVAQSLATAKPHRTVSYRSLPTPLSGRKRRLGRSRVRRDKSDHAYPTTAGKRSRTVTEQHEAIRDWESQHGGTARQDPAIFREQVLPRLRQFTLAELAQATGLSRSYCGRIRSGDAVPHVRHWESLKSIA
jgi:CRISPR-associated endonuclease Cas1